MELGIILASRMAQAVVTELISRKKAAIQERFDLDFRVASLVVFALSLLTSFGIRFVERLLVRVIQEVERG